MTLSIGDFAALAGLMVVACGALGCYINGLKSDLAAFKREIHETLADHETRIRSVERDKVSTSSWVRVVASHASSLKHARELLAELHGKIDAGNAIGAGVARLAAAVEAKVGP